MAVVVAPTLWCGMAEHHMAYGGTFTLDIPTYRAVLLCLLKSLERHGFKRVLIVNGHGGNIAALAAFLPDFARETGLALRVTTPYEPAQTGHRARSWRTRSGVHHACEVETSMMMVVAPDTVRREKLAEAHGPAALDAAARRRRALRLVPRGHRLRRDRRCPAGQRAEGREARRRRPRRHRRHPARSAHLGLSHG